MPLGLVSEIVANGGSLPQLAQLEEMGRKKRLFTKKNGVLFGVFWFIFLTLFATSFFAILEADDALVAVCAVTGVFGAMMMIIGSLVLLPTSKPPAFFAGGAERPPDQLKYGTGQQALPHAQSVPASVYSAPAAGAWRDTNDLQPASVTENTTKILERDETSQ